MTIREERFTIQNIPSIMYGDSSEKLFLYIHGKMGCKEYNGPLVKTTLEEIIVNTFEEIIVNTF